MSVVLLRSETVISELQVCWMLYGQYGFDAASGKVALTLMNLNQLFLLQTKLYIVNFSRLRYPWFRESPCIERYLFYFL